MKSEHGAYLELVIDAQDEQKKLKAQNMKTIKKENDRKQSVNQQFWHRVWIVCNIIFTVIITYTLIHFAG